jgi:hypothetical protein
MCLLVFPLQNILDEKVVLRAALAFLLWFDDGKLELIQAQGSVLLIPTLRNVQVAILRNIVKCIAGNRSFYM